MILWIDFETRSRCDLRARGVYNYAQHGTTDVLCMSYAFDDEDVQTWVPGQPFPERVYMYTGQIRAHNAAFERLIFWYVLQINFDLEQFYCTAAQARCNAAPGSLEDVGRFYGLNVRKDHRGNQLIRALSIPQKDGKFQEDAALLAEMIAYCEQDVRTMRAFSTVIRDMTPEELADYHVNERINDRGIKIDVDLANAAEQYKHIVKYELNTTVRALTDGEVPYATSAKVANWLIRNLDDDAGKILLSSGKLSFAKDTRAKLMDLIEEAPELFGSTALAVIETVNDASASSVAKFERMANLADPEDHRARGAFVFAGGAATGRFASFGIQLHNLPRASRGADHDAVRADLIEGYNDFNEPVNQILKSMLRGALVGSFAIADWSSIEARVNPWLAGPAGADVLELFKSGKDLYKVTAARMFSVAEADVTKDQRQIGKVAVLALGFGGGPGAFMAMGKAYGLTLDDSVVELIVRQWRRTNPWAPAFWSALERAYRMALRHKGEVVHVTNSPLSYYYDGLHLWCALPSGRVLCYPLARMEDDGEVSYAKAAWKMAASADEWPRAKLWPGLACENVVQATAACLLRDALRRIDAIPDMVVVAHVHDEIVVEAVDKGEALGALLDVMSSPPAWAKGLPLAAEGRTAERFGK
jgi:DNA polymerase